MTPADQLEQQIAIKHMQLRTPVEIQIVRRRGAGMTILRAIAIGANVTAATINAALVALQAHDGNVAAVNLACALLGYCVAAFFAIWG